MRMTSAPALLAARAADSPEGPPPTTSTCSSSSSGPCWWSWQGCRMQIVLNQHRHTCQHHYNCQHHNNCQHHHNFHRSLALNQQHLTTRMHWKSPLRLNYSLSSWILFHLDEDKDPFYRFKLAFLLLESSSILTKSILNHINSISCITFFTGHRPVQFCCPFQHFYHHHQSYQLSLE